MHEFTWGETPFYFIITPGIESGQRKANHCLGPLAAADLGPVTSLQLCFKYKDVFLY